MTFYNLPNTDLKIDYDAKAKRLKITGITERDRVIEHSIDNVTDVVTIELGVW